MKKESIEKNDQLLKKIGKYATAAGAVLLTGNLANAAIHVTTVNLDLQDGDAHRIDFDGDGLFDFVMTVWQNTSSSSWGRAGASLRPASSSLSSSLVDPDAQYVEVIQEGPFAYDQWDPAALPLNQIIGPTLQSSSDWSASSWAATIISTISGGTGSTSTSIGDGNFDRYPGQTRYIGIRFSSDNTNWHYGWIAVQCNSLPLFNKSSIGTLISYGYETSANQSLPAGSTSPVVPLAPLASAIGLGLVGLFGFFKSRRKRAIS